MKELFLLAISVLPLVSLAARDATVYLQPPPSPRDQKVPALHPYEANSVLANYVGLHRSLFGEIIQDSMEFGGEEWEYLWQPVHPAQNTIGAGPYDRLMLLIQSDYPDDFVPLKPTFTIPDAPEAAHFEDLFNAYISQAHNIFDKVMTSVLDLPFQSSDFPSFKGLLDVFDLTPSESTALFMDELRALVSMIESPKDDDNVTFTALKLDGMSRIAREHGRISEVYTTAAQTIGVVLSHLGSKSRKLALIVQSSDDHRRAEAGVSAPPKHGVIPIWSSSECFTTSETCSNSTNTCTGHGSCVQVTRGGKVCWACTCGTTTDSKGRKTLWAGKACERKDYSAPFALLVGTTVFLVALFIGSVKVLYSIGNAELPSTLTSTSTTHLKRD